MSDFIPLISYIYDVSGLYGLCITLKHLGSSSWSEGCDFNEFPRYYRIDHRLIFKESHKCDTIIESIPPMDPIRVELVCNHSFTSQSNIGRLYIRATVTAIVGLIFKNKYYLYVCMCTSCLVCLIFRFLSSGTLVGSLEYLLSVF